MKEHLIAGIGLFLAATLFVSAQTSTGVIPWERS